MSAVFHHELRGNFHALTTYLFGACLLVFIGLWAMMYNLRASVSNFEFVLADSCLATVDEAPVCLVSRNDVVELMEAVRSIVLQ